MILEESIMVMQMKRKNREDGQRLQRVTLAAGGGARSLVGVVAGTNRLSTAISRNPFPPPTLSSAATLILSLIIIDSIAFATDDCLWVSVMKPNLEVRIPRVPF